MKKFIVILVLGFTAQWSLGWSCDNDSSEFTDASVRAKCMYRMLSHYIEHVETELLVNYKANLGTSSANAVSKSMRRAEFRQHYFADLKVYYDLLKAMNPPTQNIYVSNQSSIPMTCTASTSSSGS